MTSSVVRYRLRAGLSLVELLGCITAVTVGIVVGAHCLGIDLHVAAYRALENNHIIEQLPPEMQNAIPVPPSEVKPVLTREEISAKLANELDEIRLEVARISQAQSLEPPITDEFMPADSPEFSATRERTVVYWSRLNDVAGEVEQLLDSTQELLDENNVWRILEVRKRAFAYGAEALRATDTTGVDPQAVLFATQLMSWYTDGSELYSQAIAMWESQQFGAETNRADVMLDHGRRQQENEASLLAERAARLCEVLGRRFGVPFAPTTPWAENKAH